MVAGCLPDMKNIIEIIGKRAVEKLVIGQTVDQQSVPTGQTDTFQLLLQNIRAEKENGLIEFGEMVFPGSTVAVKDFVLIGNMAGLGVKCRVETIRGCQPQALIGTS